MAKITPKIARFVEEYLKDLNGAGAAVRAGYSERSAKQRANELLVRDDVQAAIAQAMAARIERVQIDADYVLNRLVEIDQMDVLDIMADDMSLRPVSEWPRVWRQYLRGFDLAEMFEGRGEVRDMIGILKKIKWPDKIKNLELLGRHLGMFKDKVEVTGKNGGPIQQVTMDNEQFASIAQEMLKKV